MTVKGPFIFDSHALLKLFQKQEGYEKIVRLLRDIRKSGTAKYINAISFGEIIDATKTAFGDEKMIEALAHIERLGFEILPVSGNLAFQAVECKKRYGLASANSFVLASAAAHKAAVVTGDPEFQKVRQLVKIVWV